LQPTREFKRKPTKEKERKMAFFRFLLLSFTFWIQDFSKGYGRKKGKKILRSRTRAAGCG
jgi:hypothetical protein